MPATSGATSPTTRPIRPASLGGVQVGYNWQSGQFVFGGETDLQISGADDTFAPWKFSNPWFGTLRGRAGFAMNNILFYGTLGLAYGGVRRRDRRPRREPRRIVGWTGGLGIEVGFTPHLVGQGRISLRRSQQPRLHDHRREQRLRSQHAALRRQLSLLSGPLTHDGGKPRAFGPGVFFCRSGIDGLKFARGTALKYCFTNIRQYRQIRSRHKSGNSLAQLRQYIR